MKIINDLNFPEAYIKSITGDPTYRPNPERIGVTDLIDSPQIRRLYLENYGNLIVKASDYFTGFLGSSMHEKLQRNVPKGFEAEKKWAVKIGDLTLVGKADVCDENLEIHIIDDYKLSSMFQWSNKIRPEKEATLAEQLNCLNYLRFKVDGIWSTKLTGHIWIKDWTIYKAQKNEDEPQVLYFRVDCPVWSLEEVDMFVKHRLSLHHRLDYVCDDKDKWVKEEGWAVMEKGKKNAKAATKKAGNKRIPLTKEDCALYILEKGLTSQLASGKIYIEERKSECRRCLNYCKVRSCCKFAKSLETKK